MTLSRRAAKRDASEAGIFAFLRKAGWSIEPHSARNGPDAFIAKAGITLAIECKTGKAKLRPGQQGWMDTWQGTAFVLRDVSDAEALNRAAMPAVRFAEQKSGSLKGQ